MTRYIKTNIYKHILVTSHYYLTRDGRLKDAWYDCDSGTKKCDYYYFFEWNVLHSSNFFQIWRYILLIWQIMRDFITTDHIPAKQLVHKCRILCTLIGNWILVNMEHRNGKMAMVLKYHRREWVCIVNSGSTRCPPKSCLSTLGPTKAVDILLMVCSNTSQSKCIFVYGQHYSEVKVNDQFYELNYCTGNS